MPCIAISLHTLCSNRGIISFPMVKLTILGGHDLVLAPKIWAHVVQNCILDDTCGYIGDLVGPFLTQINVQKQAIPATKRPKSRSYVFQCLALRFHCTHCAQIMQLAQKIWAHVVLNCILDDTCVCTHSFMHRHLYTAAWCTLCDGWRVGLVHAKCHCNHIRDNRYRGGQMWPYLTLPYLTLN